MKTPPGDNLIVESTKGNCSAGHLRLEGYLAWHIVRSSSACVALAAEKNGQRPGLVPMRGDLIVLDFVCGEEVGLQVLWAVSRTGRVVGGVGTGRHSPTTHGSRPPFPCAPDVRECWAAPFFRTVAEELARDDPTDANVTTPMTGYLDGKRGHIHGGYLLGQVALEAFCDAMLPPADRTLLVRSSPEWLIWISEREKEIRTLAMDENSANILLNKLKGNVVQRPFGEAVDRAFERWGVPLPPNVLKEVKKRNRSAHDFVMFDEVTGDVQEAADRLDMVQMLLAGAIALQVGYRGPIVGWERGGSGHLKVPDFWRSEKLDEAEAVYVCRA